MAKLCLLVVLVGGAGCPSEEHEEPDAAATPRPDLIRPLSIGDGQGLLFSFFDRRAELTTVDSLDRVADTARAEVMVTDPARRLPGDLIYLADLSEKNSSGDYRVWVEPRGKWLDRVMPQLSLLAKAPTEKVTKRSHHGRQRPRRPPRQRRKRNPRPAKSGTAAANTKASAPASTKDPALSFEVPPGPSTQRAKQPRVVMFSTSWCPSCRDARQYFASKDVPFVELDVEKNMQARQQYQAIAQKFGLRPGVVPLIMIDGRPFQGFSKPQVQAALAGHSTR